MPPKIPQSAVAAISSALLLCLFLPSPASAQLKYSELVTEQGGNLAPTSGSHLVYIPEQSPAWRYWTGNLGAPASDWKLSSFIEPTGWLTGQTSVGYGDSDDNTLINGMRNNYTSVYLRHEFVVPTGSEPAMLHLRLYVDDGAIVWLNGIEIARKNITTPNPGPTATATSSVNNAAWQDYFISGSGNYTVEGVNVIAIQALNATSNSSDFSIDIELSRPRLDFGQIEAPSSMNFLASSVPANATPAIGLEFLGTGTLASKTFELRSVSPTLTYNSSSHGFNVATYAYRTASVPGFFLSHIKAWEAGDFLSSNFLKSGTSAPEHSFTQVQNHSWIATEANLPIATLNNLVRRFDYMASRDQTLCVIGLNNGSNTTVPHVWGSSYNSISVGRVDGLHSRGGTPTGVDGTGRSKPDVVSPGSGTATSYSTANVSGTAALLLGHAYHHPELSNVFHPEANKAIIMAGATKTSDWSNSSTTPLDPIYGAGTVNIYDSFHLLIAGEHSAGSLPVPETGWDYAAELAPTNTATYSFVIPEDQLAASTSIILTWFRQFEDNPAANDFATLPVLPDFELKLFESSAGVLGSQLALSDSPVDNVEHLYLNNLAAGEYTITVNTDITSPYALAWQNQLSALPTVAVSNIDTSSGVVSINLENLNIGTNYTLQHSIDLVNWTNLYTVTAGAVIEPFTQTAIPIGSSRGFYRILWTP